MSLENDKGLASGKSRQKNGQPAEGFASAQFFGEARYHRMFTAYDNNALL